MLRNLKTDVIIHQIAPALWRAGNSLVNGFQHADNGKVILELDGDRLARQRFEHREDELHTVSDNRVQEFRVSPFLNPAADELNFCGRVANGCNQVGLLLRSRSLARRALVNRST